MAETPAVNAKAPTGCTCSALAAKKSITGFAQSHTTQHHILHAEEAGNTCQYATAIAFCHAYKCILQYPATSQYYWRKDTARILHHRCKHRLLAQSLIHDFWKTTAESLLCKGRTRAHRQQLAFDCTIALTHSAVNRNHAMPQPCNTLHGIKNVPPLSYHACKAASTACA
jgi:hypothetical protein